MSIKSSEQLVARHHQYKKRGRPLDGFAFDITIRYNAETRTLIVTDLNNDNRRHIFDAAREVGEFITSQIAVEVSQDS